MSRRRGGCVVVTGGSSGIGRLTAHLLATEGVPVVVAARSTTSLDEVVDECAARSGVGRTGTAMAVTTDVRDPEAVEHLAEVAEVRFGRIDMWVNGAAVMAYGTSDSVPPDIEQAVIETNLMGTIHGCRW